MPLPELTPGIGPAPPPGHKPLLAGREVLVLGARSRGQLPLLGTDTHREGRPAQDSGGHQAPHVITGQRDPGEPEREPAMGRMAHMPVGPTGHHPVAGLDLDPVLKKHPRVAIDRVRSPTQAIKTMPATTGQTSPPATTAGRGGRALAPR